MGGGGARDGAARPRLAAGDGVVVGGGGAEKETKAESGVGRGVGWGKAEDGVIMRG